MRTKAQRNLRLAVCALICLLIIVLYKYNSGSSNSDDSKLPVEERCKSYQELRDVDFLEPRFRESLCSGASAFVKTATSGFPLCKLKNPFDESLLSVVRQRSATADMLDMKNSPVRMFIYKEKDAISENIRRDKSWEKNIVHTTMRFARRVPSATFLDAGCNIGVYSMTAARLRLPVVSLDANLRNLLRLRLSLSAAALDASLVWNFIGSNDQLSFLNFPGDCNVGGATKFGRAIKDTIPVMTMRSEKLGSVIPTNNVVLKLDIEGGEADFLRTSGDLFSKFKFAVIQMEWMLHHMTGNDNATIIDFFTSRRYSAWKTPDLTELDTRQSSSWGNSDLLWIHENFRHLVTLVKEEN